MSKYIKSYSICMTLQPTSLHERLMKVINIQKVVSKSYEGGTLYLLFHFQPRKTVQAVHNVLSALDDTIQRENKVTGHPIFKIMEEERALLATFFKEHTSKDRLFAEFFEMTNGKYELFQEGLVVFPETLLKKPNQVRISLKRQRDSLEFQKDQALKTIGELEDMLVSQALALGQSNLQKLRNLGFLAGIRFSDHDCPRSCWKRVALAVHPDKRMYSSSKKGLFEKICKAFNDIPKP